MKQIKIKIIALTMGLMTSIHAQEQQNEFAKIITPEEKVQLKQIHHSLRDFIQEGGEELRTLLIENGLGRGKGSPEKARERAAAYFERREEDRLALLASINKLTDKLNQLDDNQSKISLMAKLVPLLKQLPPPRRRPRGEGNQFEAGSRKRFHDRENSED